jgi:hypothetical protein
VATPSYSPSGASGQSQDLGLFVQRKEAGGFDRLSQFPDFGQLARKIARAPYLRKGFELVHADGRGVRRCAVLDFFEP